MNRHHISALKISENQHSHFHIMIVGVVVPLNTIIDILFYWYLVISAR